MKVSNGAKMKNVIHQFLPISLIVKVWYSFDFTVND